MAHFATYDTEPFLHNDMDFTRNNDGTRGR
jgi:hypothetical protein